MSDYALVNAESYQTMMYRVYQNYANGSMNVFPSLNENLMPQETCIQPAFPPCIIVLARARNDILGAFRVITNSRPHCTGPEINVCRT